MESYGWVEYYNENYFGKRRIEEIKSLEEWGWKISIFYVKYKIQNANFDHKNFNPWKCGFYFDL